MNDSKRPPEVYEKKCPTVQSTAYIHNIVTRAGVQSLGSYFTGQF